MGRAQGIGNVITPRLRKRIQDALLKAMEHEPIADIAKRCDVHPTTLKRMAGLLKKGKPIDRSAKLPKVLHGLGIKDEADEGTDEDVVLELYQRIKAESPRAAANLREELRELAEYVEDAVKRKREGSERLSRLESSDRPLAALRGDSSSSRETEKGARR